MSHPCSSLRAVLAFFLAAVYVATCQGAVVINEIHYRPYNKLEQIEFIELYNNGSAAVAVGGWKLDGAITHTLPAGTQLSPGAYLVVAQNPSALMARFSVAALGPWTGLLSNGGEELRLLDMAGAVVDKVDYQLGFPWPTVGDAPGYSIELINPGFDNNLGGNWRSSYNTAPQGGTTTLIATGAQWRYFRGTSEPPANWRALSFVDTSWPKGAMPIGYDPTVPIATPLYEMQGNYTTVYFRRTFTVESVKAIRTLRLRVMFDDGFKLWINGAPVRDGDFNLGAGALPRTATSGPARETAAYDEFDLPTPGNYLVNGTNVIAIQAANVSLGTSTDFFLDLALESPTGSPNAGPTPGSINSAFALNAPPQIRQVENQPKQPRSGEQVVISAKITDPDNVASATLQYQVVAPGSYVALTDAQYTNGWVSVAMRDDGALEDAVADDGVYIAVIPGSVQTHRRLIRYRIVAQDGQGAQVKVPYADDPAPNFAYFCYNGVPGWRGGLRAGTSQPLDFSAEAMGRLPAIHLISKQSEVEDATWFSRYGGDAYLWAGTLVYDGEVYDHVHFRARGGVWRYAMVKNMWKFDMNNGHYFQMRDDYGRKYDTTWSKLNLGASIQQGDFLHRGEQGMFESVGFKLFNLAGVEAPFTTFVQFRVVDAPAEAPANQYDGDFWGVYLVIEQEDGRFLDEHNLPDGNLYKMEGGTGELNNLGRVGPADKSDLNAFLNTYRNSPSISESWWRTNFDVFGYANYQAIVQGIHHWDISDGKNYFYFRNPETGAWSVHTWDLDLTWANNMYSTGGGGKDDLYRPFLGEGGYPVKPALAIEFKNRVREIHDLLFNPEQAGRVIDEFADLLRGPKGTLSILDADRYMWDYNPKMNSSTYSSALSKSGQGRFYQWPYEPNVSKDFEGAVQLMKNYVAERGAALATLAADVLIPPTPSIAYVGLSHNPVDKLQFTANAAVKPGMVIKWRVGEVSLSNAPAFDPQKPRAYEITPVWESGVLPASASNASTIPAGALEVGHAYRARARLGDSTGRWSQWSAPVEFIAGASTQTGTLSAALRVAELMPNSPAGSDFDFIELFNQDTAATLDLSGARFTAGISYTFPQGTMLAPGEYLVLTRHTNTAVFRQFYGISNAVQVAGPYSGNFANDGEQVTLESAGGETNLVSFHYETGRGWPAAADAGHSLVPLSFAEQTSGALDYPGNWRASTYIKGSPGRADPPLPSPTLVINEVVAHTDHSDASRPEYDSNDTIELFNASSQPVLLSGFYLSDDPANLKKYALPARQLAPGGFLTFDEISGFHSPITSGFGLDKAGEQVLLSFLPGNEQDRVADEVRFQAQENNVSWSRVPDGGPWWYTGQVTSNTPNAALAPLVTISEVMYRPFNSTNDNTADEFVELFNNSSMAITLSDTNGAWRLSGGIALVFGPATTIPAGGTLLAVNFDPAFASNRNAFAAVYGITNQNLTMVGPYGGKLGNRSDRVSLERPQAPDSPGDPVSWVVVDEVIYGNQQPWPSQANGTGSSLNRVSAKMSGRNPANWNPGNPTPGKISAAPDADADGDQMPDSWERDNGFDPENPADASDDADADGMSNVAEFLSGTSPHQAASKLSMQAARLPDGTVQLQFAARASRSYSILFRRSLTEGGWQKLQNVLPQTDDRVVSVVDNTAQSFETRFYRLITPSAP